MRQVAAAGPCSRSEIVRWPLSLAVYILRRAKRRASRSWWWPIRRWSPADQVKGTGEAGELKKTPPVIGPPVAEVAASVAGCAFGSGSPGKTPPRGGSNPAPGGRSQPGSPGEGLRGIIESDRGEPSCPLAGGNLYEAEAHFLLGLALSEMGSWTEAIASYQAAMNASPIWPQPIAIWGQPTASWSAGRRPQSS